MIIVYMFGWVLVLAMVTFALATVTWLIKMPKYKTVARAYSQASLGTTGFRTATIIEAPIKIPAKVKTLKREGTYSI